MNLFRNSLKKSFYRQTRPHYSLVYTERRYFIQTISNTYAKDLPGVIRKYRLAIFVDGEFWHGHQWERTKGIIKSNRDFWIPKIERHIQRDKEVNTALINMGYTVFRFWGEDVRKNLQRWINQIQLYIEKAGQGRVPFRILSQHQPRILRPFLSTVSYKSSA